VTVGDELDDAAGRLVAGARGTGVTSGSSARRWNFRKKAPITAIIASRIPRLWSRPSLFATT